MSRFAVLVVLAGLTACSSPSEQRRDVLAIDAAWRSGSMPPQSNEVMLEALQALGAQRDADLASAGTLARIVLQSPSDLARADALRSLWQHASRFTREDWRVDELDSAAFNERARRLEELLDGDAPGPDEELVEMAHWLGNFRFPPRRMGEALSLAEAVASQAATRTDEAGAAFAEHAEGAMQHAAVLVTLHASGDKAPVVRAEAAIAARYLPPERALLLVAGMLRRESDAQVVFDALDSVEALAPELPPEAVRGVLEPLLDTSDVAVRQRIEDLLARLG